MPTLCLSKWEVAKLATVSWGRGSVESMRICEDPKMGYLWMNMEMVVILHGLASLRFVSDDMTKQKLRWLAWWSSLEPVIQIIHFFQKCIEIPSLFQVWDLNWFLRNTRTPTTCDWYVVYVSNVLAILGGGFKCFSCSSRNLGKIFNLTNIFSKWVETTNLSTSLPPSNYPTVSTCRTWCCLTWWSFGRLSTRWFWKLQ